MKWRKWRKPDRQDGDYWVLIRGKDRGRISLALGNIPEDEAAAALARIQREEDAGTVSRVLALHARDKQAAVRYLTDDNALLPAAPTDYGGMTLREYHDEVYAPWRQEDRPRTWRTEAGHWTRILRDLGHLRLRRLGPHEVADFLDGLTLERGRLAGQPASPTYRRLLRAALQAMLARAYRLRHIDRLPDLAEFTIRGSSKGRKRKDPLSLDELAALLEASQPKHRAMWACGAGLGLRPSELVRVRWEDVRWSSRTLVVRGEKTEAAADEIPLTPIALRELRDWWMRSGQPEAGVAFEARPGVPYESVSGYKRALATAAQRAGISHAVHPYLLRHSFATIAWSLGVDKDVARRILRHTDAAMLDEVYCRPRPADLVERVQAFDL